MSSKNGNKRYLSISLLRGICAIFVVLFHYTCRYNSKSEILALGTVLDTPFRLYWGGVAVVSFFMISGFLIGSYFLKTGMNSRAYLTNRCFRLYPTFWICVLITFCIMRFFFPEVSVSAKDFFLNLTMIPGVLNSPFVDGAYWTMQIEFFFSACLGIILLVGKPKNRRTLLLIWIVLSICQNIFFTESNLIYLKALRILSIPSYSHLFIAGISCFMLINKQNVKYALCLLALGFVNQLITAENYIYTIFFITTILVFLLTNQIDKAIPEKNLIIKGIVFVASVSYPWYLIHQMIGYEIIKEFVRAGITTEWIILIPIAATLLLAYFIHLFIELPSGAFGKKLSKRYIKLS